MFRTNSTSTYLLMEHFLLLKYHIGTPSPKLDYVNITIRNYYLKPHYIVLNNRYEFL